MKKFLSTIFGISKVLAETGGISDPSSHGLPNPLGPGVNTFNALADKILGYLIIIAAPIATLMILVGAYQILFSAGNPEKVNIGKRTILYTVVAFAIILIGKGITLIIKDVLGVK